MLRLQRYIRQAACLKASFVEEILMPAQPVEGGFPNPVVSNFGDVYYEDSA